MRKQLSGCDVSALLGHLLAFLQDTLAVFQKVLSNQGRANHHFCEQMFIGLSCRAIVDLIEHLLDQAKRIVLAWKTRKLLHCCAKWLKTHRFRLGGLKQA